MGLEENLIDKFLGYESEIIKTAKDVVYTAGDDKLFSPLKKIILKAYSLGRESVESERYQNYDRNAFPKKVEKELTRKIWDKQN